MIVAVTIFLFCYGAIEFYSWRLLRSATAHNRWASFWKYFYFVSFGVSVTALALATAHYMMEKANSSLLLNLLVGLFFSFLLAKSILCILLLPYDLFSSGKNQLVNFLSKKNQEKAMPDALSDETSAENVSRSLVSQKTTGAETGLHGRRNFLIKSGMAIASLPFASFVYGVTAGKYNFRLHNHSLSFRDLPGAFDGFRIIQISDLHLGSFDSRKAVESGLQMLQAAKPDLILFTGDMVNNFASEIPPYIKMFSDLQAPYGKFSVLGNHDYGEYSNWPDEAAKEAEHLKLMRYQKQMGFELLNNRRHYLERDGESICLAGVENWGTGHFVRRGDLNETFRGSDPGEFTVLMSHDPTHWDAHILPFDRKIHLTLSGHTHGAQLGVEIPNLRWSPASYVYEQWAGLYEKEQQQLYVNRGFGFIGFPGRVGIWPEITLLELKKAHT